MRFHRLGKVLVVALAMCAGRASAFLDPPYITPTNPTSHDAILVSVYGGECDVLNIGIVPPAVSQEGGEVTVLFTGIHEGDPEFCYYGIGTSTYTLGIFPPGAYKLDVERRYMSFSGPWVQETLGIIPFTVSSGPMPRPVEATTLNLAGLAGLLLGLIATAHFVLRRKI